MSAPLPAAPDHAGREDVVAVQIDARRDDLRRRLDDLLTRSFYSGAGYVFESDPFVVPDDADLLAKMTVIREQDRRHAHVLATLIAARGGVPSPEVFPFWDLDLNYLTVPTISRFVVDALVEEIVLYDALLARWPADDDEGRKALRVVRDEKERQVADLRPAVEAALAREAETYRTQAAAVKKVRDARLAKQKAAAEAARKAKAAARPGAAGAAPAVAGAPAASAPAAAIGDPNEPGISKKEKGRRALLRIRQKHGLPLSRLAGGAGAAAPSSAPTAAAAAQVTPAPPTPPAAAAGGGGALLDPNEPGIPPKEKARRQMLKMRAAAGGPPAAAPAAPAPAAAPAPVATPPAAPAPTAAAAEALPADLGDPDEPGITPKEKARRQMARIRAKRG